MDTKKKIAKIIKDYKTVFPDEMATFEKSMKQKQKLNINKFAAPEKTDYLERKLWEMPETLYDSLFNNLTDDEFNQYFRSKTHELTANQKWFLRTYPVFKAAEKL